MWKIVNNNSMNVMKLKIVLATREIARFVVQNALENHSNAISLKNAKSASRSFLDELYLLSKQNHLKIIDVPENILPMYKLIQRSHLEHKVYAPEINVTISDKTFA